MMDEYSKISTQEKTELDVEFSQEELHSMIKSLYYSKNGFSVAFSTIFNLIASNCHTAEKACESIDNLSETLKRAMVRYFSGQLDTETMIVNGVRVTQIKSKEKMN